MRIRRTGKEKMLIIRECLLDKTKILTETDDRKKIRIPDIEYKEMG